MARSGNDDRSDTMNPNNDAYWADQANRFGNDWGDDEDPSTDAPRPKPLIPDRRFGPDPHPVLGRRSNRLPSVSTGFTGADPPRVVPFAEEIATLFVTDESEARDRKLALAEMMVVAEWILGVACEAMTRQGNSAAVEKRETEDGPTIKLSLAGHWVEVRSSTTLEALVIAASKFIRKNEKQVGFRFHALRWHLAEKVERGWVHVVGRTSEEDMEARRREHDVVEYRTEERVTDPAAVIVDVIRSWATQGR